jgi:ribonuclease VapC
VIVDTSALLAIIFGEPGFEVYVQAISDSSSCRISAANFVELSIVAESRVGDAGVRQCEALFRGSGISIEPLTEEQAYVARKAYSDYGRGRHAAGLNFGDCFSYALAKASGEPLLFKGDDFSKTDITPALV